MGGRRKAGAVLYRSAGGRRSKTLARGDCLVFVPSGAAPGLEEASEAIELNGISRKSREDQLADILRMVDKDMVQDRALLALFPDRSVGRQMDDELFVQLNRRGIKSQCNLMSLKTEEGQALCAFFVTKDKYTGHPEDVWRILQKKGLERLYQSTKAVLVVWWKNDSTFPPGDAAGRASAARTGVKRSVLEAAPPVPGLRALSGRRACLPRGKRLRGMAPTILKSGDAARAADDTWIKKDDEEDEEDDSAGAERPKRTSVLDTHPSAEEDEAGAPLPAFRPDSQAARHAAFQIQRQIREAEAEKREMASELQEAEWRNRPMMSMWMHRTRLRVGLPSTPA